MPAETQSILLVNPWIHDFSAYDLWMKPLGLLYLGALLEKYHYKVHLLDLINQHTRNKNYGCGKLPAQIITKPLVFKDIPRYYKRFGISPDESSAKLTPLLSEQSPVLILVTSMMTYWYPGVVETIKYLKNFFPKTPVVLGGVYATLCYEHAVKYSGADYVVNGPGEEAVLKLARQIIGQTLPSSSDENDYPAYHLYFTPQSLVGKPPSSVAMLTSRGCPFRCTYCGSSRLQKNFYQYPPDKVFAEIGYYVNTLGIKDIAFYDDALLVDSANHIEPLLDLIIKSGIAGKVRFHTPNGLHIRYITPILARKLYQAGFKTIRLGLESTHKRWQESSAYKTTNEEFLQAVGYLKEAGFSPQEIGVYVMMGLPGQTITEISETIDFTRRIGVKIKTAQYTPVPRTKEFNRAVNEYHLNQNEPLLHNKNIYPLRPPGVSWSEMDALKKTVV